MSTPPVEMISSAKRKSLPKEQFALPSQRKYPIDQPSRVRNAAARLEQNKARLSPSEYASAKRRIAKAAKRFGIQSQYNEPEGRKASERRRMRMRIGPDGSIDISHGMKDGGMFAWDAVELKDPEPGAKWIQVAKAGTFKGHKQGPFSMSADTFREIIQNFKTSKNREIPVDFEHATEAPATEGSIPTDGAPAQGWIKDLEVRANGKELWGLVEWGDKAREYIQAKQYKYFSPAIRFATKDRVTGEPAGAKMTSGALTNNPFLDGMEPLAARDFAEEPTTAEEQRTGWVWLSVPEAIDGRTRAMSDKLSFDDVRRSIQATLDDRYPRTPTEPCSGPWVCEVYDTSFVYEYDGHYFECGYVIDDKRNATLGQPTEVRKAFVALTDDGPPAFKQDEYMPQLRKVLRLDDFANAAEMQARCHRLRCMYESAGDAHGYADGVSLTEFTKGLREFAALPMTASIFDALDAVDSLLSTLLPEDSGDETDAAEFTDVPAATPIPEPAPVVASDKQGLAPEEPAVVATDTTPSTEIPMDTITKAEHDAKVAELSLQLKDAQSKAEAAEKAVTAMKAEQEERDNKARASRVDRAFAAYKDSKKLTDDHKEMMAIVLKDKPELFEKLYPELPPDQVLLTRRVVQEEKRGVGATPPVAIKMSERIEKYMTEGKLSREDATSRAFKDACEATRMAG